MISDLGCFNISVLGPSKVLRKEISQAQHKNKKKNEYFNVRNLEKIILGHCNIKRKTRVLIFFYFFFSFFKKEQFILKDKKKNLCKI